jgi:hypothetical protein
MKHERDVLADAPGVCENVVGNSLVVRTMIPLTEIACAITFFWWRLDLNVVDASLALEAVGKEKK